MVSHQGMRTPEPWLMAAPEKPGEKGTPETILKERAEKPRMWKVLLHNDDYTTQEFVTWLLIEVFRKSRIEAVRLMLQIHTTGKGVGGVYTKEVAETRAALATDHARAAGFPLLVTTEPEST